MGQISLKSFVVPEELEKVTAGFVVSTEGVIVRKQFRRHKALLGLYHGGGGGVATQLATNIYVQNLRPF